MFRTNCIMHFLLSSSVFVIRYIFKCACFKLLSIDINGIAFYHIAYKEYLYLSYKLNFPPSPIQEWPAYQNYSKSTMTTQPGGHKEPTTNNCRPHLPQLKGHSTPK